LPFFFFFVLRVFFLEELNEVFEWEGGEELLD